MLRAYKYKIKPTREQRVYIDTILDASRFIYNHALARRKEAYEKDKTFLSDGDLYKEINFKRKIYDDLDVEEFKSHYWMNDIPGQVIINKIRDNNTAFKNMIRHSYGYPRFKKKGRCRDSFCLFNAGNTRVKMDFTNHSIRMEKIGWVRFSKNQEFDLSRTTIRNVTVSRDTRGVYSISVLTENNIQHPPKAKVDEKTTIGIDLGVTEFLVTSDGERVMNNRYLERSLDRLRLLSRSFSRKQKGSKRREKARMKIARLHGKIHDQREDFLHKLSRRLLEEHDTIIIEDLDVRGMMRNRQMARSIASVGWTSFTSKLVYKAEWMGKNVHKIDRYYASSKKCGYCGHVNKSLTLADRSWICTHCLTTNDRDLNAAKNIKSKGLKELMNPGRHDRVNGHGDGGYEIDEVLSVCESLEV